MHTHTFPAGGGEAERRLLRFAGETPHPLDAVQTRLEGADAREALRQLNTTDRALIAANARSNTINEDSRRLQGRLLTVVRNEFRHLTAKTPPMTPDAAFARLRETFQSIAWMRFELNAARTDLHLSAAPPANAPAPAPADVSGGLRGRADGTLDYLDALRNRQRTAPPPAEGNIRDMDAANRRRGMTEFAKSDYKTLFTLGSEPKPEDPPGRQYTAGELSNYRTTFKFEDGDWWAQVGYGDQPWTRTLPLPPITRTLRPEDEGPAARTRALAEALLSGNANRASSTPAAGLNLPAPSTLADTWNELKKAEAEITRLQGTPGANDRVRMLRDYVRDLKQEEDRRFNIVRTNAPQGIEMQYLNGQLDVTYPGSTDMTDIAGRVQQTRDLRFRDTKTGQTPVMEGGRVTGFAPTNILRMFVLPSFWGDGAGDRVRALKDLPGSSALNPSFGTRPQPAPQPTAAPAEQPSALTDRLGRAAIDMFKRGESPAKTAVLAALEAARAERTALEPVRTNGANAARYETVNAMLQSLGTIFSCSRLAEAHQESVLREGPASASTAGRATVQAAIDAFGAEMSALNMFLNAPPAVTVEGATIPLRRFIGAENEGDDALDARHTALLRKGADLKQKLAAMPPASIDRMDPNREIRLAPGFADPKTFDRPIWGYLNATRAESSILYEIPYEQRTPAQQQRLNEISDYRDLCEREIERRNTFAQRSGQDAGLTASVNDLGDQLSITYPANTDVTVLREALEQRGLPSGEVVIEGTTIKITVPASFWQKETMSAAFIRSFRDLVPVRPAGAPAPVPAETPRGEGAPSPSEPAPSAPVSPERTDDLLRAVFDKLAQSRHGEIRMQELNAAVAEARRELQSAPAGSERHAELLSAIRRLEGISVFVAQNELKRISDRNGAALEAARGNGGLRLRTAAQDTLEANRRELDALRGCGGEVDRFIGMSKSLRIAQLEHVFPELEAEIRDPNVRQREAAGRQYLEQLRTEGALELVTHLGVPCYRASFLLGVDKYYFTFLPSRPGETTNGSWQMSSNKSERWLTMASWVSSNGAYSYRHIEDRHQPREIARRLLALNQDRF